MNRKPLLLCLAVLFGPLLLISQSTTRIGEWQDQFSLRELRYLDLLEAEVYAASSQAVFRYSPNDGNLERFSKVNGLSDVDISSLYCDPLGNRVIIGYENGNLDFMEKEGIVNFPDIALADIISDQSIRNIDRINDEYWLSCGFGIVVINPARREVSESYYIGNGGASLRVNDIALYNGTVYAATDVGLMKASLNSNLADYNNWSLEQNGLLSNGTEFKGLVQTSAGLFALSASSNSMVQSLSNGQWSLIMEREGATSIRHLDVFEDEILVTLTDKTQLLNAQGTFISESPVNPYTQYPKLNMAVRGQEGKNYLADQISSLITELNGQFERLAPASPFSDSPWAIAGIGGELWIAHGEVNAVWDNTWNNDGFSGIGGVTWIRSVEEGGLGDVRDLVDVVQDPLNPNKIYFSSFNEGLLEYRRAQNEWTVFNDQMDNSNLTGSNQSPDRIQSSSLTFDHNGNLWVTNNYTDEGFKVRKRNGDWEALDCSAVSNLQLYGDLVVTEEGQTWCVLPRGGGALVLQHNNELVNTTNHQCKKIGTSVGQGALPTNTVLSIAEDLEGEIWIGTSEGPVVNYAPSSVFSSNSADFQSILVERDGNVERLLGSESITAIAVDGADRKWLGTQGGGVFLLSSDGQKEIHHFTTENSPLPSNEIRDISIDPMTGSVHFATNKGVISYLSDATLGAEENDCSEIYPNPVRPNYHGPITIEGLMRGSEVKITDVAGNIVFQTISKGGRATWSGQDFSGNRVATGVYFALVSDPEGSSTCISKVLFIN